MGVTNTVMHRSVTGVTETVMHTSVTCVTETVMHISVTGVTHTVMHRSVTGVTDRDRPKFSFGYGVSAKTTQKYGFRLVSVMANRDGRITVSAKT